MRQHVAMLGIATHRVRHGPEVVLCAMIIVVTKLQNGVLSLEFDKYMWTIAAAIQQRIECHIERFKFH